MGTYTIPGPVVSADNVVIRTAFLVSESDRAKNNSDYHRVEIAVRAGDRLAVLGTYNQSNNKLDAGEPRGFLTGRKRNFRLRENQQVIVRVTEVGDPPSITDMRVTLRMAVVGGSTGPVRPLVRVGSHIESSSAREAVDGLVSQIGRSRLNEWDESIALIADPGA